MQIKSVKSIIEELCSLEGHKVQVDVAQMSEIVSTLSALMYLCPETVALLILNGKKVSKKYSEQMCGEK